MLCFLAGCATDEHGRQRKIDIVQESTVMDSRNRSVVQENTLSWYEDERGGAAYREKGYRHVLFSSRNLKRLEDHSPAGDSNGLLETHPAAKTDLAKDSALSIESAAFKSYSMYETGRWERFCGAGKMDSRDWDFIAEQGREFVPAELREDCAAPAYTRQDYLAAWKSTCAGGKPSSAEKVIRQQTLRPAHVCELTEP
jgi:hypothetical protein